MMGEDEGTCQENSVAFNKQKSQDQSAQYA